VTKGKGLSTPFPLHVLPKDTLLVSSKINVLEAGGGEDRGELGKRRKWGSFRSWKVDVER